MHNSRSANSRTVNPLANGSYGFYNASGNAATEQAQKNIADATKNLTDAIKNQSDANTAYANAVSAMNKARQAALDCDARRAKEKTGPAKNRACGNRDDLYAAWDRAAKTAKSAEDKLASANQAVELARKALDAANIAAEKVRNADPQYALEQQQIIANQNVAQAQINANQQVAQAASAQQAQQQKTKLFVFAGIAIVGIAALAYFLKKGKGSVAAPVVPAT